MSVRLAKAAALLFAASLLTAFPGPAPAAPTPDYFYDWATSPSVVDPPETIQPPYEGQDITKAWHAYDGAYHYFRIDLQAAPTPSNSGETYGIFLNSTAGGSAANDPYVPESLSGIDFILSSTYEILKWDAELLRWTKQGFRDSEDLKFQAAMNDGATLEWRVRDTLDGAKYFGDSFTWWAATMLVGEDGGRSTTYDLTSAVPIPNAVWLFGSGLVALIGLKRRKTGKS